MSSPGRLGLHIEDGIASVMLDNPAQRNALTRDMCLQLRDLMPRLDADQNVTIVTLRGVGDTFCAGASLAELSSVLMDDDGSGNTIDRLSEADDAITSVSKPTLALVDGACMGGGWQLASACDFIVASERSLFAITPAKLGIIYPRPGIERLIRQVGPATAKYILFTAETYGAVRAQTLGLVAEVVSDGRFADRCVALAETIRDRSRFSTFHLKRLVDGTAADDPELESTWEQAWASMADNPDLAIGVEAFMRREMPVFTWRETPEDLHGERQRMVRSQ